MRVIDDIASRLDPTDAEAARTDALTLFGLVVGTLQLARALTDRDRSDHLPPARAQPPQPADRRSQIAIIAVVRKLAVLFWHLLTRGENYAYGRLSLTDHKLRQIELLAGADRRRRQRGRTTAERNVETRDRKRQLTAQAEQSYRRLVADWQQNQPNSAGAAPGRASSGSHRAAARRTSVPGPAL